MKVPPDVCNTFIYLLHDLASRGQTNGGKIEKLIWGEQTVIVNCLQSMWSDDGGLLYSQLSEGPVIWLIDVADCVWWLALVSCLLTVAHYCYPPIWPAKTTYTSLLPTATRGFLCQHPSLSDFTITSASLPQCFTINCFKTCQALC